MQNILQGFIYKGSFDKFPEKASVGEVILNNGDGNIYVNTGTTWEIMNPMWSKSKLTEDLLEFLKDYENSSLKQDILELIESYRICGYE